VVHLAAHQLTDCDEIVEVSIRPDEGHCVIRGKSAPDTTVAIIVKGIFRDRIFGDRNLNNNGRGTMNNSSRLEPRWDLLLSSSIARSIHNYDARRGYSVAYSVRVVVSSRGGSTSKIGVSYYHC
jgi:hypothetical protein